MAATLASKNIGDVIKIRENGVLQDFIIAHKGLPSAIYDTSCDGVWIVRKYVYPGPWSGGGNNGNYASGPMHSWLENTYYNLFDANTKSTIKYVRIPYSYASGGNAVAVTNSGGLAAHCFLLSMYEIGSTISAFPQIGSTLSVFNEKIIQKSAYDAGGTVRIYWLRDAGYSGSTIMDAVVHTGNGAQGATWNQFSSYYLRPAMILDYNTIINDDGTITINTAPSTPGSISVPGNIQGGSTITISWGASSDAQNNLGGYKLERSVNSSAWVTIYQGGATSTTNNVAYGTNTVMYRVKAYDNMGLESGYRTSNNITVINNTAPGTPQGITVPPDVRGGSTLAISWGPSVDAQNNLAGYELERSVDGGTWTQVFKGAQQTFIDNIAFGWQTVAYRVKAYDAYSLYSGYVTSETRAVDNNRPSEIACEYEADSDLGVKSDGFTINYTVTDPDNNTGEVTVTETLDGTKKKEYTPELGAVNDFAIQGVEFQCLANGQHTISISANDSKLTSEHVLTFTKTVTSAMITLETPLEADDQITACAIAISGYIPPDAQFRVLVTNNANDAESKWENCTQMVKDGANYVFSNQIAENGYAFNFKITVSRGESEEGGYISSVQGGFQ